MAHCKTKLTLPSDLVKPTKKHYDRFISQCQGVYCETKEEKISSVLTNLVEKANSQVSFHQHEPVELALSYGFKKGLLHSTPASDHKSYSDILFTDKGFALIDALKAKTCIFTGKRFN
jgi:hypothetical protein